jgi:putative flippase GtrA
MNFIGNKLNTLVNHSRYFTGYVIVGALNFLLTAILYWILLKQFLIYYIVSFFVSWTAGVLFTYILNFLYVFKPEDKLEFRKRLWKYFIVYALSLTANILLLSLGVEKMRFDPFWYQFVLIPMVILINYIGIKNWALKPIIKR